VLFDGWRGVERRKAGGGGDLLEVLSSAFIGERSFEKGLKLLHISVSFVMGWMGMGGSFI